jgi:transposase
MQKNMDWAPGPGARILAVERDGDRWVISAVGPEIGSCPGCREPSTRRHSRYFRHLQDLPAQGAAVTVKMQASRWRCLNGECERRTFTDQLPEIVVLTLVGPNESLNLFILSATARAGGQERD